MSDVNKLDNKQCPFDPEQYKSNDVVAPVGTSPWALIQVYLGNKVHRKDWDAPDEYIHLVPGSGNDEPEIKKRDKHGGMTSWQPAQEDLMACDWSLLKSEPKPKPEDCMLSFDLVSGAHKYTDYDISEFQRWGYLDGNESQKGWGGYSFGTLTRLRTTTDIENVLLLFLDTRNDASDTLYFEVSVNQNNRQTVIELLSKNLYISVENKTYNLGTAALQDYADNTLSANYTGEEANKLGEILKQTDQPPKHFVFEWK
ncbi:MW1434 family type I TA system toxin [Xenorhabdus sp. TH1]|uniref:Thoeris anti-defense Tad2 family protein n=1 Tax=Xenorhabdus sp. TH1 TaxID=3130166 RepID=UPI0030D53DF0